MWLTVIGSRDFFIARCYNPVFRGSNSASSYWSRLCLPLGRGAKIWAVPGWDLAGNSIRLPLGITPRVGNCVLYTRARITTRSFPYLYIYLYIHSMYYIFLYTRERRYVLLSATPTFGAGYTIFQFMPNDQHREHWARTRRHFYPPP